MKSNTDVHIAIRNFGDASDQGEFFHGALKDGILWLAAALGSKVMQKRFAIGIGRDRAGAEQAIELRRANAGGITHGLADALDALLEGETAETILTSLPEGTLASQADARDTWTPIA